MRNQHNITAVGVADTAPAATGRPAPSFAEDRTGTVTRPAPGTARRLHAGILLLAPAVMAAGLLYHPAVGDPIDPDFLTTLGAAVRADTVRWAVAHHMVAVGSGLLALAFLALEARLREAGQMRAAAVGFPLIVGGSLLYALLPAMEFAPLAAVETGADPGAAQAAIFPWFIPTLYASALLFAAGSFVFARGIVRSRTLGRRLAAVVAVALVVAAACRLIPINRIHMDVQAVVGLIALWPLAYVTLNDTWRRTS